MIVSVVSHDFGYLKEYTNLKQSILQLHQHGRVFTFLL